MTIKNTATGRHIWYEADHGIQRDPLRDAIREQFPTSGMGWNVNDVDLRVCLFGEAVGRDKEEDGWIIEFEVKRHGAYLKHSQVRTMVLLDKTLTKGDPFRRSWGGCWMAQVPDDVINGCFRVFRPMTKTDQKCVGVNGFREWIAKKAPRA